MSNDAEIGRIHLDAPGPGTYVLLDFLVSKSQKHLILSVEDDLLTEDWDDNSEEIPQDNIITRSSDSAK